MIIGFLLISLIILLFVGTFMAALSEPVTFLFLVIFLGMIFAYRGHVSNQNTKRWVENQRYLRELRLQRESTKAKFIVVMDNSVVQVNKDDSQTELKIPRFGFTARRVK